MHDRARIPALTLLGLSFTTCVERDPKADDDPIVGDWIVVAIDATKYPQTYMEMGAHYTARNGWSMKIAADLSGDLTFYYVTDYDNIEGGEFYRFDLTVDASAAPKYRIEVPNGLVFPVGVGEGDVGVVTVTTDSSTYGDTFASTGHDSSTGTDTDTSTGTGAPDLAIPIPVLAAPSSATLILNCTLARDALDCQREPANDGNERLHWRFARPDPEKPSGI